MKKNIILGIIITLLVVCVAVEGFFLWKQSSDKSKEDVEQVQKTVESPSPIPTTKPTESPSPVPTTKPTELQNNRTMNEESLKISRKYGNPKKDELVYTYLTVIVEDKLNYYPEYDEDYRKYKYEVPQINLKSKEVEKINKEILKKYEDIIDEINEEQKIDLWLSYKYYENDGILSLVMINHCDGGFTIEIYNIEISTGKEIDNNELLEKIDDITEKNLNDRILKAIDSSGIYKLTKGADEELIKEQQNKTINRYKNISIDEVTLYINEKGNLCAYLILYAFLGGEVMPKILDLETGNSIYVFEMLQ